MKQLLLALIVVILAILIYYFVFRRRYDHIITPDGNTYYVLPYENSTEAAALMSKINVNLLKFLKYLRDKYRIDVPGVVPQTRKEKIANAILNGFNYETLYENNPINMTNDTSYTINKGDRMHICLRDKEDTSKLIDYNTVVFVVLHEISHIGHYDGWGHGKSYWETFKFVLGEAVRVNFYNPIDYAKSPVNYCGLRVAYQPLYDKSLSDV